MYYLWIRRERGNSARTWYWHFDTLLLLWYFVDILVPDVDTFQVVDIKVWCPYQGIIWSQMQGIATILKFDTFVLEIRSFMKIIQMVCFMHNTFHFMRNSTLSVMKDLSKFSSTTWVITIPICTWKKHTNLEPWNDQSYKPPRGFRAFSQEYGNWCSQREDWAVKNFCFREELPSNEKKQLEIKLIVLLWYKFLTRLLCTTFVFVSKVVT